MKLFINKIYFILIILASLNSHAQQRKTYKNILHCLGMEELAIHRMKDQGPIYKLNQAFISEIASGNLLKINPTVVQDICSIKDFSPSVKLLRVLLLKGKSVYIFNEEDEKIKRLQMVATDSLQSKVHTLFFQYLISLQNLAKGPDCLYKEIPEFDYFTKRFRYLQEEIPPEKLMADKQKIRSIFEKLKGFSKVITKCKNK
jgi:hypothetical protein